MRRRAPTRRHGKVFPVSGPHTRWIPRARAGCPAGPGVPVRVLEEGHGPILHHGVMWRGGGVDHAVPMVEAARARFPDLRAVRLGRGFHSPADRVRPGGMPGCGALPEKGCLDRAGRERECGAGSAAMRRRHAAVEPAAGSLEHRGPGRVLAFGARGSGRTVAPAAVATDVHRIGLPPRRAERLGERRRRAA